MSNIPRGVLVILFTLFIVFLIAALTGCETDWKRTRYKIICDDKTLVEELRDYPAFERRGHVSIWYDRFDTDKIYVTSTNAFETCVVQSYLVSTKTQ